MITVYTAIFGSYETLKEPLFNSPELEYICFTDKELESKNWEIRVVPIEESSPRRQARKIKILSHEYIDNPMNLWIDGSRYIYKDPIPYINKYLIEDFCISIHPDRDCVYKEALECLRVGKGEPEKIGEQMDKYICVNYPEHNGMVSSCVILRNRTPEVIEFEKDWWYELNNFSERDQLSFNYIAWKNEFKYSLFNWREITKSGGHK